MPAFPAENLFLLIQFCRFMDASYTLSTVLLMQFGSVQVYGGSARMELLHDLFAHMVDKHSLATADELRPFEGKASLLAAVDYHVSLHSNIFFSASRGNMHNNLVIDDLAPSGPPLHDLQASAFKGCIIYMVTKKGVKLNHIRAVSLLIVIQSSGLNNICMCRQVIVHT
jgi:hypothetical protein